jgi:hypothetical protein
MKSRAWQKCQALFLWLASIGHTDNILIGFGAHAHSGNAGAGRGGLRQPAACGLSILLPLWVRILGSRFSKAPYASL